MFLIHKIDDGIIPSFEYRAAGAITPKAGLALCTSSGVLALATGTTKPEYICMEEHSAAVTSGTVIAVIRVRPEIEFAVPAQETISGAAIGTKVTLYTDGAQVTATTTSGTAHIVGREGTAAGDIQYVRFD